MMRGLDVPAGLVVLVVLVVVIVPAGVVVIALVASADVDCS
jgi:hypothetical protein